MFKKQKQTLPKEEKVTNQRLINQGISQYLKPNNLLINSKGMISH